MMEPSVRPVKLESQNVLGRAVEEYWKEANQAREKGKLIAWTTPFYPTDILTTLDIFPIVPENHAATAGVRKMSTELCEMAEIHGYSPDICSYARTELGSSYAGTLVEKGVPDQAAPDLILISNNQCTTIAKWFEAESRIFNVPFLMIDAPIIHDHIHQEDYARIVNYVKEQIQEHISFLEQFTKRRFDYDRFKECVALTGKIGKLYGDILDMGQHIPSPLTFFDAAISLPPILIFRGSQRGVDCYETLLAELKERVKKKVGAIPNEKYRLYWDDGPVWFELSKQVKTFASFGACPIIGPYPQNWRLSFERLTPAQPLESTAEGVILPYANRAIGWSIDFVTKMAKDFSLDGMVMGANKTCKAYRLRQMDIAKAVEEKIGIPSVFFDVDLCDSRLYNDAHFQTRIQAFIEVLETRARRRS